METIDKTTVSSEENVIRLLSTDWVVNDEIQHTAFMLRTGESYISVNRPAVDTFSQDIANFLSNHPNYYVDGSTEIYQCAMLNVGDIKNINVEYEGKAIDVMVEVEPRDIHSKSHAGIFTRFHDKNLKNGDVLNYEPMAEEISADVILLDVRFHLLKLSTLEKYELNESQFTSNTAQKTNK